MANSGNTIKSVDLKLEDYQKLLENLRIRINVLNASFFLLEEKMSLSDLSVGNYISKINNELEQIRKMMSPYPTRFQNMS